MGDIRLVVLTNQDKWFYPLMGPYLSRRSIMMELGAPVYDDDGKLWFVAIDDDAVCGFAGLRPHGQTAVFCSDYVRPSYRKQHVHDQLMQARLSHALGQFKVAKSVVTTAGQRAYERHGFVLTRQRVRYAQMQRGLE